MLYWVMFVFLALQSFWLYFSQPSSGALASSFSRFLDHTQRHTTVGRTPLDEWSARRLDLYLTAHNTHNRQTSMPPVGFEPTISAGGRLKTYALERAATGTGLLGDVDTHIRQNWSVCLRTTTLPWVCFSCTESGGTWQHWPRGSRRFDEALRLIWDSLIHGETIWRQNVAKQTCFLSGEFPLLIITSSLNMVTFVQRAISTVKAFVI